MIRIGHAAENMSTLRRLALNLVKMEKSLKIGMAAKRKRAGIWSICERYSDSRNKMRLPWHLTEAQSKGLALRRSGP